MPRTSFAPFAFPLALAAALLPAGCAAPAGPVSLAQAEAGHPLLLGANPWASRQPSRGGRRISTVEYLDGQVYVGFGDWGRNTGPIAVSSWEVETGAWRFHYEAATEAIERFRRIGGDLLLPYVDPVEGGGADFARGPGWREERAGEGAGEAFYHVFDAAETEAGLFLIGTRYGSGEALVRHWDGRSWSDSLLLEGRPDWFWFGAVLDGELVVQSREQGAFRYDGEAWRARPPLFASSSTRAVVSAGDRVAGISRGGRGHLQVSDGERYRWDPRNDAIDLNLDQASGWVYLLRRGALERSRDLEAWETVSTELPVNATAVDVGGGFAWIGTARGQLWALKLPE